MIMLSFRRILIEISNVKHLCLSFAALTNDPSKYIAMDINEG